MSDTMNAGIYLRVSTEDQADRYGLDVQRERCRAMAAAKGWHVAGEYADPGISGTVCPENRPGLSDLLTDVGNGILDAVVVLSLDRVGRAARITLEVTDQLQDAGATFVSVKEAIDTSTPAGRLFRTMLAGMAEFERDVIVQRTTDGRNARGKVDGEKGGRVPFGYVRTPDCVRIDPEAASVVCRIFRLREAGLSLRAVADELNASKTPTPQNGARWYGRTVKVVLDNCAAYRGGHRGNSPVAWPAILANADS